MSENGDGPRIDDGRQAALEAELHELLRRKYKEHWRGKAGGSVDAAGQARLQALQEEIKRVFDAIRLLDKKYRIPTMEMRERR